MPLASEKVAPSLVILFIRLPRFYPRSVWASGYCRCLRMSVCVCVCVRQSLACPHDNSGPAQARITKFGPKMQNTLIVPIVLWSDRP